MKIKKAVLWLAVIFLSLQIFRFSAADNTNSDAQSYGATKVCVTIVQNICPNYAKSNDNLFKVCSVFVRKLPHFSEYALLCFLTFWLVKCYSSAIKFVAIISYAYVSFYAACDEIHQYFVPGRHGCVQDVILDMCGALTGLIFVIVLHQIIIKYTKREKI